MSTVQPRLTALASTLAAGGAVLSATMIGGVPTAPVHNSPLFDSVQKDVGLVATNLTAVDDALWTSPTQVVLNTTTFAGSLQWLLDNELKIGNATLPKMLDPSNKVTVESLLSGSHLGVSSSMTDVFNQLGLQNFTMGEILKDVGMPASSTIDDLLTHLGLGNATLSGLMTEMVGFGQGETLADLVDKVGMGGKTVSELMTMVGMPGTTTVDGLLGQLGVGELQGLLGVMGVTSTTNLSGLIGLLGAGAGSLTLDDLMHAAPTTGAVQGDGFLSSVGGMTLGQLLGFTSATTLTSVLNGLHFTSTATMGNTTLEEVIGLVKITPSMTLSTLLSDLPLGVGSHANLGADSLGQFLTNMTTDPATDAVTATTTVNTLLTDMGMGALSLDALIGLPTG